jgi:peptidoglycan/LPS O-acetylase OafA/YrhL
VVSVLIYHAGLAWTPGGYAGVDVFFVISGFLITSLMLREVEGTGRLSLLDFWARRARRLLPASTLVLAFSGVVAYLWLPVTSRRDFGGDIVSAALYVVNWRLGLREVDYMAENVGVSPVQHYWSLAVEEQFYVVWPLLIAALVVLVRSRRRIALLVGVGVLTVASFVFTLSYAVEQPGLAFFFSTTRVWELGVGALLAIAYPILLRLPAGGRAVLGWVGLASIVLSVLTLDASTTWPGTATLTPVLGTAAVILAGGGRTVRWGAGRLLGLAPAVWIGGLSYELYLWHWPVLVAAEGVLGDLRVRWALVVVMVSALPAWLSFRFVERPLRGSARLARPRRALAMGATAMALSCFVGLSLVASFGLVQTVPEASAEEAPGARALAMPAFAGSDWAAIDRVDAMRPTPLEAADDYPAVYRSNCVVNKHQDGFRACEYGAVHAKRTVVLVGDSKAAQWFTPVRRIAEQQDWRLVVILKNGCEFADVIRFEDGHRNLSCEAWAPRALRTITEMRPDVVLAVTRWASALSPDATSASGNKASAMVDGLVRYWGQVVAAGATLVPILDTPGPPDGDAPGCVQKHPERLSSCAFPADLRIAASGAAAALAAAVRVPEAAVVDMSPVLCPDGETCPAVIGNVLVYRTGSHISDTFAETATEALSQELAAATDGQLGTPDPLSGSGG